MLARSRFQIGPSKQLQNNRCLALHRPPACARQRPRFRRLLSRPPGSFRSLGIGFLCIGHAFAPSEHFLYRMFPTKCPTKFRAGGLEVARKAKNLDRAESKGSMMGLFP